MWLSVVQKNKSKWIFKTFWFSLFVSSCHLGVVSLSDIFCSILFYSRLRPSTAVGSRPPVCQCFLSFVVLIHTAPCCPTMSSLKRRVGLPTDLSPFYMPLWSIHCLSFGRCVKPISCSLRIRLMFITLALCLMMVPRVLSFSLTFSSFLSIVRWLVSTLFTNAFVSDHVCHNYAIANKTSGVLTSKIK